jgi:uncharacterized iron-regulated protein
MHPFAPDMDGLSDQELDNKIMDLSKKYFQAIRFSPSVSQQIVLLLESYKSEQQRRFSAKFAKSKIDGDDELDELIRVD